MNAATPTDPPLEAIILRWPLPDLVHAPRGEGVEGDALWRLIVASMLRRGATRDELDAVWPSFFLEWPTSRACVTAPDGGPGSSVGQIEALGDLHVRRVKVGIIRRFSRAWVHRCPPTARVTSMPGCRRREDEAHRVFGQHWMEPSEAFEEPEFSAWLKLRVERGWDFKDETEVVLEALRNRLNKSVYGPMA